MKTTLVKEAEVVRSWYVADATDQPVGRLAVKVAAILRGKDKPTYTPHVDTGGFVVVINAAKIKLTGNKEDQKLYKNYSGYPNGLKVYKASQIRARKPSYLLLHAVKNMLPKNNLSRHMLTRLKIYAGPDHPHAAQQPKVLEL